MAGEITVLDLKNAKLDAETISEVAMVNYTSTTTTNRDGDVINTLAGQLALLGYAYPVAYGAGIVFGAMDYMKTINYSGVIAALKPEFIPYTTTGTWASESSKFFTVQDLAAITGIEDDIADLVTLSGVAANATNLGTFDGVTIPDDSDNKEAFQALETKLESVDGVVDDLNTLSGVAAGETNLGALACVSIPDNLDIKDAVDAAGLAIDALSAAGANAWLFDVSTARTDMTPGQITVANPSTAFLTQISERDIVATQTNGADTLLWYRLTTAQSSVFELVNTITASANGKYPTKLTTSSFVVYDNSIDKLKSYTLTGGVITLHGTGNAVIGATGNVKQIQRLSDTKVVVLTDNLAGTTVYAELWEYAASAWSKTAAATSLYTGATSVFIEGAAGLTASTMALMCRVGGTETIKIITDTAGSFAVTDSYAISFSQSNPPKIVPVSSTAFYSCDGVTVYKYTYAAGAWAETTYKKMASNQRFIADNTCYDIAILTDTALVGRDIFAFNASTGALFVQRYGWRFTAWPDDGSPTYLV